MIDAVDTAVAATSLPVDKLGAGEDRLVTNHHQDEEDEVPMEDEEADHVEIKPPPPPVKASAKLNGGVKREHLDGKATGRELRLMLKQLHSELRQEECKLLLLKRLNYAQKIPPQQPKVAAVPSNGQPVAKSSQAVAPINKVRFLLP